MERSACRHVEAQIVRSSTMIRLLQRPTEILLGIYHRLDNIDDVF
jgi:hypothetical protein